LAREVITVNGGGLGDVILNRGEFRHVRRPIWPLDSIDDQGRPV